MTFAGILEPMASTLISSGEFADRLLLAMDGENPESDAEERTDRITTKKKGNPRRLSKKERIRQRSLKKL